MEQATFCIIIISFWIVLTGLYVYCNRVEIRTSAVADIEEGADSGNQEELDEDSDVHKDAEEQKKIEERKERISEALVTILILDDDSMAQKMSNCCNEVIIEKDSVKKREDPGDVEDHQQGPDSNQYDSICNKGSKGGDAEDGQTFASLSCVERTRGEECIVCLNPFRAGDRVAWSRHRPGECGHAFHEECISNWLLARDECPMCRRSLFLEDVAAESGA